LQSKPVCSHSALAPRRWRCDMEKQSGGSSPPDPCSPSAQLLVQLRRHLDEALQREQELSTRIRENLRTTLQQDRQALQQQLDCWMDRTESAQQEHLRRHEKLLVDALQPGNLSISKQWLEGDTDLVTPFEYSDQHLWTELVQGSGEVALDKGTPCARDLGGTLPGLIDSAELALLPTPMTIPLASGGETAPPLPPVSCITAPPLPPDSQEPQPLPIKSSKAANPSSPKAIVPASPSARSVSTSSKRGKQERLIIKVDHAHEKRITQRITEHRFYEWASIVLIIANALYISWQTQWTAEHARDLAQANMPQDPLEPAVFTIVSTIFSLAFAAELGLRWIAQGFIDFFKAKKDFWWNIFDVVVVAFGLIDAASYVLQMAENDLLQKMSLLRVMRVARIVRVARVIRVMRFFRELRLMIFSILGSLKSLLWCMLVLNGMFLICGISLTSGTVEFLTTTEMWHLEENQNLIKYFGTLDTSMLSLYMAMSGGKDWADLYELLVELSLVYKALFLSFISVALVAVVNIVTGIFVESAMHSSQTDKEVVIHEEIEAKQAYLQSLQEIFEEMDEDDTGTISIEEFEKKLQDERVIAYFSFMKLDVSDARNLFTLIDYDLSGDVSIEEFVHGCHKLQGESRTMDIAMMQYELKYLKNRLDEVFEVACHHKSPGEKVSQQTTAATNVLRKYRSQMLAKMQDSSIDAAAGS